MWVCTELLGWSKITSHRGNRTKQVLYYDRERTEGRVKKVEAQGATERREQRVAVDGILIRIYSTSCDEYVEEISCRRSVWRKLNQSMIENRCRIRFQRESSVVTMD